MAKFDLLSDSIAEIKALKKTAHASAQLTLTEMFQPSLQRMISSKLAEEDELEEDEVEITFGDEDEEMAPEPAANIGFSGGEDDGGEEEMEPEGDDLELESLKNELDGGDEDFMDEGEEDMWSDPIDEDDEFGDDTESDMGSGMREPTEDEVMEHILREFDDEESLDLDENEDGAGAYEETAPIGTMNQENYRKLRRENKKLKSQFNEALRAITVLKSAINETNLLNAKLMYTTKTFKAYPLTESQQSRILDSFDRARNVREVKLVYTTVVESFNKKPIGKKRMNEGIASKPMKTVKPKSTLNEGSDVLRWKQLAGLAKIEY